MNTLLILVKTEFKLALREFSGVLFGIALPLGLMFLLGIIYGTKPAFEGASFTLVQQSVPAVITVGIIATGLMGIPLTLSAYRDKKILKRLRVTPVGPGTLLMAQVLNNLFFAGLSSVLIWISAKVFFGYEMIGKKWVFIACYFLTLMSIYSIGMLIASVSKTTNMSNLLTSLIYFPMFFLSGATVPYEIMPRGLQIVSDVMPLTHGIKLLKAVSLGQPVEKVLLSVIVLAAAAVICAGVSLITFRWD